MNKVHTMSEASLHNLYIRLRAAFLDFIQIVDITFNREYYVAHSAYQ